MTGESLPPAAQMARAPWWRSAVIYQIWPQSFADADGDGTGDLPGITARLGYLARLGVDAIWLSPFYRSPRADAGYDVADYRQIDPAFGTLEDFDDLLTGAHRLGLRVMIDLVPNHTSDQHTWFRQALASQPGSAERARYLFRDGKGDDWSVIPNNWISDFGGPAWTRLTKAGGTTDQWYLHSFAAQQPNLNWQNPEVREKFSSILRFWLDRGVDGFRVGVAHGLVKEEGFPDWDGVSGVPDSLRGTDVAHGVFKNFGPMWDQDGVHEIYRNRRKVLDSYPGTVPWSPKPGYLTTTAWHATSAATSSTRPSTSISSRPTGTPSHSAMSSPGLRAAAAVGAPATWVLSNHDVVRHASRLGLPSPGGSPPGISAADPQPDEDLGLRRVRAATMLMLALPGSAYLWQGEELGLAEHTTLDNTLRQDPIFFRTNGAEAGRDGCRITLAIRHTRVWLQRDRADLAPAAAVLPPIRRRCPASRPVIHTADVPGGSRAATPTAARPGFADVARPRPGCRGIRELRHHRRGQPRLINADAARRTGSHGIAARGCDGQPPRARHRRMACFVSPPNSPPGTDT